MPWINGVSIGLTKETKQNLEEYKEDRTWEEFFRDSLILIAQYTGEDRTFKSYIERVGKKKRQPKKHIITKPKPRKKVYVKDLWKDLKIKDEETENLDLLRE